LFSETQRSGTSSSVRSPKTEHMYESFSAVQLADFLSADTEPAAAAICKALSPPELPEVHTALQPHASQTSQQLQAAHNFAHAAEQITAARHVSKRATEMLAAPEAGGGGATRAPSLSAANR
jgi:hypothetical protein